MPNRFPNTTPDRLVRLDLAGAADARRDLAPASALIRCSAPERLADRLGDLDAASPPSLAFELVALDRPEAIGAAGAAGGSRLDATDAVLLPAMVNAHTHLDLTEVGPVPLQFNEESDDREGAFQAWLEAIRASKPQTDSAVRDAVLAGVRLSLASGVLAVGDIAGALGPQIRDAAVRTLLESPLLGV
ncbi:MAG: hypothetical protein AAGK04_13295, partial [Planctomycetota bacterium]